MHFEEKIEMSRIMLKYNFEKGSQNAESLKLIF